MICLPTKTLADLQVGEWRPSGFVIGLHQHGDHTVFCWNGILQAHTYLLAVLQCSKRLLLLCKNNVEQVYMYIHTLPIIYHASAKPSAAADSCDFSRVLIRAGHAGGPKSNHCRRALVIAERPWSLHPQSDFRPI